MTSPEQPAAVEPEDREIVQKLAKLQSMHNQVSIGNSPLSHFPSICQ